MTTQYSRSVLRLVVAQICQTIGWHSINSTPLEFMVDLMQEYIFQLSKLSQQYAQVLGRCDANLDDLGLAFRHMNIDLQELAEYVRNVDSVPCAVSLPKIPVHKESHLNFLKPGSREVVTRPVHVHEHLPAMYPNTEEEYPLDTKPPEIADSAPSETVNTSEDESNENNNIVTTNGISSNEDSPAKAVPPGVFKRPGDPISFDGPIVKRAKTTEEGRPLREIHSVIMTTSGFLSTAREGKLPEARTPQQARAESPPPEPFPTVPPEIKVEKKLKKIPKKEDGKPENKENKKKKIPKDNLFQPDEIKDVKVKKLAGMKELAKLKVLKPGSKTSNPNLAGPSNVNNVKIQGKVSGSSPKPIKSSTPPTKTKTEKSDIVQNIESTFANERKEETIDKLPIEPDKQKLNIFKKISSKSKEDKEKESDLQHKSKEMVSQENSPALITGENLLHRNDISKQEDKKPIAHIHPLVNNNNAMRISDVTDLTSPSSNTYAFDMSPPATPGAPKTPEVRTEALNFVVEKKKRKDKIGKKKEPKQKIPKTSLSPKKARLSSDSINEVISLDRPKTPTIEKDIQLQPTQLPPTRDSLMPPHIPYPMFPAPFQSGPGLIPHPMFPMPMHKNMPRMPTIAGVPNSPAVIPGIMHPRFRPPLDGGRPPFVPPSFVNEPMTMVPSFPLKQPQQFQQPIEKQKAKSPDKEFPIPKPTPTPSTYPMPEAAAPPSMLNAVGGIPPPLMPTTISPVVPAPLLPPNISLTKSVKPEKDKSEKKSKEHKKEKKDKMKKKKEKKEKHKDKGEKIKEKKDKSDKKDKLEKIKEKKEKKEKRKEKEASKKLAREEKVLESVPKLTLKLGLAGDSPRPSTPDSALTKKIIIKQPKKPEEEVKREPTPELARISALVTRPPKQKSTSKKAEESLLEAYGNLSSEASFSCSTLTPNSRGKKPVFKALPQQQPSPSSYHNSHVSLETQQGTQYCFTAKAEAVPKKEDTKEDKENGGNSLTAKSAVTVDPSGRTVWICPACGKEDDGSPMIGCDNCDAWYHWVCVGIQVAPAENVNWYCRLCIAKKQESHHDKKKKKRKKKVKVSA